MKKLPWHEYNLHIRIYNFENVRDAILDFICPFINTNRDFFQSWNFLIEPDVCELAQGELRLRFKGTHSNLETIQNKLIIDLQEYARRTAILIEDGPSGSHEGCHGVRHEKFLGASSEDFGEDWPTIVELLQSGSEHSLEILELGRNLKERKALQKYYRQRVVHPYYLHLPANQLIVEP